MEIVFNSNASLQDMSYTGPIDTSSHAVTINSNDIIGVNLTDINNPVNPLKQIQEYLNVIKEVFLTNEYDDQLHGWIVEDHIQGIQEVLDAHRF